MKKYIFAAIGLLFFTRFVGLGWGLPFALHPDEMNMVSALTSLSCPNIFDIHSCMNPHFFAYGQFPLYLGYVLVFIMKLFDGDLLSPISFNEATVALRFISVMASFITVFYLWRIFSLFRHLELGERSSHAKRGDNKKHAAFGLDFSGSTSLTIEMTFWVLAIFTPGLIQFAHFGTTESLLMACYTALAYYCINYKEKNVILKLGVIAGIAIATKMSGILFLAAVVLYQILKYQNIKILKSSMILFVIAAATAIILSPHNLINWSDFLSSMGYESGVGLGNIQVFYTEQFRNTIPIVFQALHVFPYSLGLVAFILFIIGFVILPYNRLFNTLRLFFLVYFIPNAFFYTKWTRFMAPILPIMILFSVGCISLIYSRVISMKHVFVARLTVMIVLGLVVGQGASMINIYLNPDIRFEASRWISMSIPSGKTILTEDRNVVTVPIDYQNKFKVINFDFYDLQTNKKLQDKLVTSIQTVDYIIVPSRRVYANYANDNFPQVKKYYDDLNRGASGFKLIKEFKREFWSDEFAEETFSVFDHPTIRVYRKLQN